MKRVESGSAANRMSMSLSSELTQLEERIQAVKNELSSISNERWHAALKRDDHQVLETRNKAAEKMLENCGVLAQYVSQFCPAVGRDISGQEKVVRGELEKVKRRGDHDSLHAWYKVSLIPLVKRSEVAAHVAATSRRKTQGVANECHRWPLSGQPSHREKNTVRCH